jgi:glycerophosphoryl diester phosphodiesterase
MKNTCLLSFTLILLLPLLLLSCSTPQEEKHSPEFELIAHRGFAGLHVENTLEALHSSIDLGADALEFDISVSSGGTPYLFHDAYVDEITNGTGKFTELTDEYIEGLQYVDEVTQETTGYRIAKLETVLKELQPHLPYIYPEIKQVRSTEDIKSILEMVSSYGFLESRSTIQSFNEYHIEHMKKLYPGLSAGFLISSSKDKSVLEQSINLMGSLSNVTILTNYNNILRFPELVEYCENKGMDVGVWTVNELSHIKTLTYFGVTKIMSDYNLSHK